uniref:Uncharacterized protein n=1 Tax=Anguilla anguilla TaxID=7936 RepID=A0A0E9PB17_ANGAN
MERKSHSDGAQTEDKLKLDHGLFNMEKSKLLQQF